MVGRHRMPAGPAPASRRRLRDALVRTVPMVLAASVAVTALLGTGVLDGVAPVGQGADRIVPVPTFTGPPAPDGHSDPEAQSIVAGPTPAPTLRPEGAAAVAAGEAVRAAEQRVTGERVAAAERAAARRVEERAVRTRHAEEQRRERTAPEEPARPATPPDTARSWSVQPPSPTGAPSGPRVPEPTAAPRGGTAGVDPDILRSTPRTTPPPATTEFLACHLGRAGCDPLLAADVRHRSG